MRQLYVKMIRKIDCVWWEVDETVLHSTGFGIMVLNICVSYQKVCNILCWSIYHPSYDNSKPIKFLIGRKFMLCVWEKLGGAG
jgi:hypothetical protein